MFSLIVFVLKIFLAVVFMLIAFSGLGWWAFVILVLAVLWIGMQRNDNNHS